MPVVATSIWSVPSEKMRALMAAGAGFWAFAGVDNEADALDRIHLTAFDGARPFALVWSDTIRGTRIAAGQSNHFRTGGVVYVAFERDVGTFGGDDAESRRNAEIEFQNLVGDAIRDAILGAGSDDAMDVTEFSVLDYNRSDPDQNPTRGDHFWALVAFHWGRT